MEGSAHKFHCVLGDKVCLDRDKGGLDVYG
jgi:hypothetical protein